MGDYKPNSHRFKNEKKETVEDKKIEKVVKGQAKTKKKGKLTTLTNIFISDDISDIKSYVMMEVFIPAAKKAISDVIETILYGEAGKRKRNSGSSYVSYRDYSGNRSERRTSQKSRDYCYDDVIVDTRGEADEVLARMDELIETYGMVSVADLYDLAGLTCDYTANKYGWMNISNARAVRIADGYILKMPRAVPID